MDDAENPTPDAPSDASPAEAAAPAKKRFSVTIVDNMTGVPERTVEADRLLLVFPDTDTRFAAVVRGQRTTPEQDVQNLVTMGQAAMKVAVGTAQQIAVAAGLRPPGPERQG